MKNPPSERCPNCPKNRFVLYHPDKEKVLFPGCKSYACPEDGWKRQKELRDGLETWLANFRYIRFWSFTISSKDYDNPAIHYRVLSQAWRYFVTYLRRSKIFTPEEQTVQYIKIYEQHKSGFLHIHAFFDLFIDVQKVFVLWNTAIRAASNNPHLRGYCFVKGKSNIKAAARYVVKYVTKLAKFKQFYLRIWSKSGKTAIFKKFPKEKGWLFMLREQYQDEFIYSSIPLLEYSKNNCTEPPRPPPEQEKLFETPQGFLLYEPDYPW